jgi:hypothetical protein
MTQPNKELQAQLHKELKAFHTKGLLYPVYNSKLSPQDHYMSRSKRPIRKATQPLFDRLQKLSITQKENLLPHVYDTITILEHKSDKIPSWLGDTITTRKKYDHWYWKTRLSLKPFNNSVKSITNPLMTKLQQRAHEFHLRAAIERNSHLQGPPKWILLQSIEW